MGYEKINRPLLGEEFNDPDPVAAHVYLLANGSTTEIAEANVAQKAAFTGALVLPVQSGGAVWNNTEKRIDLTKGRKRIMCVTLRGRINGTLGDVPALFVALNGDALIQSFAYGEIGSDGANLTSTCLLEAGEGDHLEIYIANELNTNNVTLKDFSFEVHPV